MQDMEQLYEYRELLCPAAGRVIPLHELVSGENPRRHSGEGFAVSAAGGVMGFLFGAAPAVGIHAPAAGAITAAGESLFRLRTGDGLELSVELCAPAEFLKETGELAAAGECVCLISQEEFRAAPAGAVVIFADSSRITEFHVISGTMRAGKPAAEYKLHE